MPQRLAPAAPFLKILLALPCAAWMATPAAFKLMLMFMAFDAITAIFNPVVKLKRRVTILSLSLLLSIMVHLAWYYATHNTGINLGFDLVSGVCTFYALGSAVDIIVNFHAAGVPVPPVILNLLTKAQGLTGRERAELDKVAKNNQP